MASIKLTNGSQALVDDDMVDHLNQWTWYIDKWGYASRNHYLGKVDGKYKIKIIKMHREINGTPVGGITDHINGNRLDNRRENLRTVTRQQNNRNTGGWKNSASGVKGVYWDARRQHYQVKITVDNHSYHLGVFTDIEQAKQAYNEAAIKHFGEFARLHE